MIERDPAAAIGASYDLVVVGGGIQGVAVTLEAARRGLRPLLLERDDFGGATSWNSLRILHGGLRHLQTLDLRRYRDSIAERRWFMSTFPESIEPLPSLMPLYGTGLRRPTVMSAALALDHRLSRARNRGLEPRLHLAAGRVLSPAETIERLPAVERRGLAGGALWNDAFMPESPRVLIEMLRWACACGARALNYVELAGLETDGPRVVGVTAKDRESGGTHRFQAPHVVNCAGPWCGELAQRADRAIPELQRPTLAFNLVLDRPPPAETAVAVYPPEGTRSFFLVPWRGRLMAGTYHGRDEGPSEPGADDPRVTAFLEELNRALPALELAPHQIVRVLAGRLPGGSADADLPAREAIVVDHRQHGGPRGLVSVAAVKYTTARSVAEQALAAALAPDRLPPPTDEPRPTPNRWPSREEIESMPEDGAELGERLKRLIRDESVLHLDDLLLRRTDLGLEPEVGARLRGRLGELLPSRPERTA